MAAKKLARATKKLAIANKINSTVTAALAR